MLRMLTPDFLHIRTESLTQIMIWSLFIAFLSLFLEFCMREKKILGFWLEWLSRRWLKRKAVNIFILGQEMERTGTKPEGYESLREWMFDNTNGWFFRLNRCVVCFNIWIGLFFCLFTELNVFENILVILSSNFTIRLSYGYML